MKLLKLVPDDTNIKFLKWRIPFFAVSILLIAASWALVFSKGLNYGVDFAGGLEVRATFTQSQEAPVAELQYLRRHPRTMGELELSGSAPLFGDGAALGSEFELILTGQPCPEVALLNIRQTAGPSTLLTWTAKPIILRVY